MREIRKSGSMSGGGSGARVETEAPAQGRKPPAQLLSRPKATAPAADSTLSSTALRKTRFRWVASPCRAGFGPRGSTTKDSGSVYCRFRPPFSGLAWREEPTSGTYPRQTRTGDLSGQERGKGRACEEVAPTPHRLDIAGWNHRQGEQCGPPAAQAPRNFCVP